MTIKIYGILPFFFMNKWCKIDSMVITTANLSSIIRHYAEKQKSPFIDLREFCGYVKKYAERHVEEQAELVKYLGDSTGTVLAELKGLEEKKLAILIDNNNKKMIVSISYFAVKFANRYKEMHKNETIPFPLTTDLPKKFPINILDVKYASTYIPSITEKQNTKSPLLYILNFEKNIPSILLPACVPLNVLVEIAQSKILKILKKDEYHDYFLKKLRSTNPTKEIAIKNFFSHFIDIPQQKAIDVTGGDEYYLWSQLCYFIRQDFEKIQDRTGEDINILQAIAISEIYNVFLKQKFQEEKQREQALKSLETALAQSPYFFSMNQILKFHDESGRLLYGQYSEDDLREFLQKMTTEGEETKLPPLLVFKVESGTRYYVFKNKINHLLFKLCNEAHDAIENILLDKWYNLLLNYEKRSEMTDTNKFEECLRTLVESVSPVLHSLLNANFITLLGYEDDDPTITFHLFSNGKLLPYRELLMLNNSHILSKAKARLPFIYSLPIISWIVSLFRSKKKVKTSYADKQIKKEEEESHVPSTSKLSKQEILVTKAKEISADFVPEGSTIDRELDYLNKQWNKLITHEANMNLTEDVNALIRDYTRRVSKTLTESTFTKERIKNLAEALVKTPNMQKIREEKALTEYVTLYMIRLLCNAPKK